MVITEVMSNANPVVIILSNHGILNLRQCMQHFEFWLRVRCLVARFFTWFK